MAADAASIANYFLDKAEHDGIPLDHLKIQKLVYIAHGWHLGLSGSPLVFDRIEAWPYGPVFPELYHVLKPYGMRKVTERITEEDPLTGGLVPCDVNNYEFENLPWTKKLLDWVWNKYKGKKSVELSSLTHTQDSPWSKARQQAGENIWGIRLSDRLISEHYKGLAQQVA